MIELGVVIGIIIAIKLILHIPRRIADRRYFSRTGRCPVCDSDYVAWDDEDLYFECVNCGHQIDIK